jgi:phage-related protein
MPDRRLRYVNDRVAKDLEDMPERVREVFAYALVIADHGGKHPKAKPMKGLGPGVMEVVARHDKKTYRLIYTTEHKNIVYVVHCFQKKSTSGVKTPDHEIQAVKARLKGLRDRHGP